MLSNRDLERFCRADVGRFPFALFLTFLNTIPCELELLCDVQANLRLKAVHLTIAVFEARV